MKHRGPRLSNFQAIKILAVCCALVACDSAFAQSIHIGRGGVRVRSGGNQINVGRHGVQFYAPPVVQVRPQVRPQVQPLPYQGYSNPQTTGAVRQYQVPGLNYGYGGQGVIYQQPGILIPQAVPQVNAGYDRYSTSQRNQNRANFVATNSAARVHQNAAEAAMRAGDYDNATAFAKRAVRMDRENGALRLFSSQAHLAVGDYEEAADELDVATKTLAKQEWNLMIRNVQQFDSPARYQNQLRQLVEFLNANPNSPDALSLYGFHAAYAGQIEPATRVFERATRIDSNYALARRLQSSMTVKPQATREVSKTTPKPKAKEIRNPWQRPGSESQAMDIQNGSHEDVEILAGTEDLLDLAPSGPKEITPSTGKPVSILRKFD